MFSQNDDVEGQSTDCSDIRTIVTGEGTAMQAAFNRASIDCVESDNDGTSEDETDAHFSGNADLRNEANHSGSRMAEECYKSPNTDTHEQLSKSTGLTSSDSPPSTIVIELGDTEDSFEDPSHYYSYRAGPPIWKQELCGIRADLLLCLLLLVLLAAIGVIVVFWDAGAETIASPTATTQQPSSLSSEGNIFSTRPSSNPNASIDNLDSPTPSPITSATGETTSPDSMEPLDHFQNGLNGDNQAFPTSSPTLKIQLDLPSLTPLVNKQEASSGKMDAPSLSIFESSTLVDTPSPTDEPVIRHGHPV